MADAIQPLADAIADRVWAQTCQEKSFGRQRRPAETRRSSGAQLLTPRTSTDGKNVAEKYHMLQTRMNELKGNTSPRFQLDLASWYERELRRRLARGDREIKQWSRIIAEAGINQSANLDTIIDCLLVCTPAPRQSGQVYFMRAGDLVKIGISQEPSRRLAQIRAHSPVPVECEITVYGEEWHERYLHVMFAEDRESGEWFRATATLNELIRLLKLLERKG